MFIVLRERLKNVCGLEINSSKTEGMWIGSQKNNDEKSLGINWQAVLLFELTIIVNCQVPLNLPLSLILEH